MTPLSAPPSIRVSWLFDVISPFAYLAFPRLEELPAGVELEVVPVLLAALLDHFGQRGPAEIPSKRRFTYRFVLWRARRLGLPLRMPPAHPLIRSRRCASSSRRAAPAAPPGPCCGQCLAKDGMSVTRA